MINKFNWLPPQRPTRWTIRFDVLKDGLGYRSSKVEVPGATLAEARAGLRGLERDLFPNVWPGMAIVYTSELTLNQAAA